MRIDHHSELVQALRDRQPVQLGTLEIADEATAQTNEVMMTIEVRVESNAVASRPENAHEPLLVELPNGPVDGIQRHGRHAALHRAKDSLRIGMLFTGREFSKDLQALVRQLHTGILGGRGQVRKPSRRAIVSTVAHSSDRKSVV